MFFDKRCESFQRFDQVHVDLWSWHYRQWGFLHELVQVQLGLYNLLLRLLEVRLGFEHGFLRLLVRVDSSTKSGSRLVHPLAHGLSLSHLCLLLQHLALQDADAFRGVFLSAASTWAGPFAVLAERVRPRRNQTPLVDIRVLLQLFNLSTLPTGFLAEEAARVAPRTLPLWLALTSQCLPPSGLLLVTVQAAVHDFFPFGSKRV